MLKLRRAQNYLGPDRIADDADQLYGVKVSRSTVYAILKRAELICKRFAEKLTKKHLKRYRRPLPGYLQIDIKYVPYKVNGEQWYQISCVDHHSGWRLVRLYRTKCISSALKFLEELKGKCPFPIIEIQTDNDATFTDKFTSLRGVTGEHPF